MLAEQREDLQDPLSRYVDVFSHLTADSLDQIRGVMTEDVHFVDPFNDLSGIDKVIDVFDHMFQFMPDSVFTVTHSAYAHPDNRTALLRWHLHGTPRRKKDPMRITGMSIIRFSEDGLVREHIDHWDAAQQVYENIPVLGTILRAIRRRI